MQKKREKQNLLVASVIALGIVSLFDFNPIGLILFAQAANGLVLPVASVFLLMVLNNRTKMRDMANNRVQNIIGVAVILLVSLLGLWNIARLFL